MLFNESSGFFFLYTVSSLWVGVKRGTCNGTWNGIWNGTSNSETVKKTAKFRLEKKRTLVQLAYCCTQRVESGSGSSVRRVDSWCQTSASSSA